MTSSLRAGVTSVSLAPRSGTECLPHKLIHVNQALGIQREASKNLPERWEHRAVVRPWATRTAVSGSSSKCRERLSGLALLCPHPRPCHLLCMVTDLEMGYQAEKGVGGLILGCLGSLLAHPQHTSCHVKTTIRERCSELLPYSFPLPRTPLHPRVRSAPALCPLPYVLWLFSHEHFFSTFRRAEKLQ